MEHQPENSSSRLLPGNGVPKDKNVVSASYTEVPNTAGFDPGPEPPPGGLIEYFRILRRRKGTLIVIAFAGTLIGLLVTVPQTRIYQAHTSLEILGLNGDFLNLKQSSPVSETGTAADTVDIQTQIKLLQSNSLIDRVQTKLLSTVPTQDDNRRVAAWRKFLNLPEGEPVDLRKQALSYAARNLKVRALGQTRVIEATVDSSSPDIAAVFANTLAEEFIDQSLESRWKTTEHTGEWLTRQIDDMRIRLERSEDKLAQYARQAGLIFTEDKTNVSEQKLLQVQEALSGAQTDRIAKQSRWEMANASPPEALPDILNDAGLREYQTKLTELNREFAELRATFTPEHAKVKRVQAQVGTIQAALERERGNILKRIRNEYEEATRREKLLEADYAKERSVVTGEGERSVQYNILKQEVESNRQLYDSMLQQLKQAAIGSAFRASNIRVVDPAKPPVYPYKPDLGTSGGIGLLSGIFLGAAFIIMRERADRTIQEPGECTYYTNLPELGIIPSDQAGNGVRMRVVVKKKPNGERAERSPGAISTERKKVELVTLQRKPSIIAESFRATLVSILFSGENGSRPRVMVISSAGPSEGKSTVVSNLGIAVAEVNQKVLLIDADLRKPRLHDIFSLKNDRGLSDLLRSKDPTAPLPQGIIQETSVPELFVLTSGSTTNSATSLLYSNRMPELLMKLRTQFETIFIDTPPMLQIPDARVLGRVADRVILVVRTGKTTRDAALSARQRFSEDGTQMLGTILNDWNPKRSPNGFYGYYSGYYSGYYRVLGHYGIEGK